MSPRGIAVLLFLLILVPSAQFMWHNRDMPDFADLHDDGILFVSGQSLAQGQGYRIASLPSRPYQTKYPPLYPLLLSVVWRLNPNFPQNLVLASVASWFLLPICLALAFLLYGDERPLRKYRWWMVGLLGLCPYMVLFGARMFSEIAFTCLALGTLYCLNRVGSKWIVIAGLTAAAAYLTRTAGIALIGATLVTFALRRQWRNAAVFTALTAPFVLGWSIWTRIHLPHTTDLPLMYYIDYLGFQKVNVGWDNFPLVLWKNVDQILYGMGSLFAPKVFDLLLVKILTQVVAVAMIAGIVRLVRQRSCQLYAIFGLFSCVILVVWHYPPNERFVLPLYPLLLAGLFTEMAQLGQMLWTSLRRPAWSDRIVATGFGGAVACLLTAAVGLQCFVTFVMMPETSRQKREQLASRREAYSWIKINLPANAAVFSYDDPLLYLYSGHKGSSNPLLPRYWYAQDHARIVGSYRNFAEFCRRHQLAYVYLTSQDALRETDDDDRKAIDSLIRHDPSMEPVHTAGIGTIFRVHPDRLAEFAPSNLDHP